MISFSGNDDINHRYGVAALISNNMMHSAVSFTPVSDRVLFLQLQTTTGKLIIILIYAPTVDKPDEENYFMNKSTKP